MTTTNTQPTKVMAFGSVKGGSGLSTVAAVTAVKSADTGKKTLLIDHGAQSSLAAILGAAEPHELTITEIQQNLDLIKVQQVADAEEFYKDYDAIVIDTTNASEVNCDRLYLVIRNCYLAARLCTIAGKGVWDAMVVVHETERPLTPSDMSNVLRLPIAATVQVSPAVARATDAGLLGVRIPNLDALCELSKLVETVEASQ